MSFISKDQINHIRDSVDIVDVISSYISLTPRGKNYFGVCPFHDDSNPSMSVSRERQMYTCFSCGATGNVFSFVMNFEHIGFKEALNVLAHKANISIDIGPIETKKLDNPLYDIYKLSLKFYQNNLQTKEGRDAKSYLKSRGIDDELIKEFEIGLSLVKRDYLSNLLLKKNFEESLLIKSGLIIKNDYGLMDIYSDRIMFPLWDLDGNVVGYSGRMYRSQDLSKYINTKETEIFKKGELLYFYHKAKEEARIKKYIIVMEGFMDVIRAYSVGIKNVVATMGTAVTHKQAQLLKKLATHVILCFDGDKAGEKATWSCGEELLKVGITPSVIRLDHNMDPDEYIKTYGLEHFQHYIDHPIPFMEFQLQYLKKDKDLSNMESISSYVKQVLQELEKIEDDILRELTLKKISEETNLEIDFLRGKLKPKEKKVVSIKKQTAKKNKYQKAEQYLLYYMLEYPEVIELYNQNISYLPTEKYRLLAREISYFYQENQVIQVADLLTILDDSMQKTVGEIVALNLKENYTKEVILDYIKVIEEYTIKQEIRRLSEKMKQENNSLEKAIIAQEIVALKVRGEKSYE